MAQKSGALTHRGRHGRSGTSALREAELLAQMSATAAARSAGLYVAW